MTQTLVKAPTYRNLFGETCYHDTPKERSVLSHGAYLEELRQLVSQYITITSSNAIYTRRPDIEYLLSVYENTLLEVPKLQIINQVLQAAINDTNALSQTKFPFNLPFDQNREQIRACLQNHDQSLSGLWCQFNATTTSAATEQLIQLERLQLTTTQWQLYSTPITTGLADFYGMPTDTNLPMGLDQVPAFLRQTGLAYEELKMLVGGGLSETNLATGAAREFFINQGGVPIILLGQKLKALSNTNLDRCMRFIRLAKAIDWSFPNLDLAIKTANLTTTGEPASAPTIKGSLPVLSWIQQQLKSGKTETEACCAALGYWQLFGQGGNASFYDQVFNNPLLPANNISASSTWTVPDDGSTSPPPALQHQLAQALGITDNQLQMIGNTLLTALNQSNKELPLTMATLGQLYRPCLAVKVLSLTIEDILAAISLCGLDARAFWGTDPVSVVVQWKTLTDFCNWARQCNFSITELDFILTGNSTDPSLLNKLLSKDGLANFTTEVSKVLTKTSLTPQLLQQALLTPIKQTLQGLTRPDSTNNNTNSQALPNESAFSQSIVNSLYQSLTSENTKPLSEGSAHLILTTNVPSAPKKGTLATEVSTALSNALVANGKNTVMEQLLAQSTNSKDEQSNPGPLIQGLVDDINQVFNSLYQEQQQAVAQSIAGLLKIDLVTTYQLMQETGLTAAGFTTTTQNGTASESAVHQLQRLVLLITHFELSPAEVTFISQQSNTLKSFLSLENLRSIAQYRQLKLAFQDGQNHLLGLLSGNHTTLQSAKSSIQKLSAWDSASLSLILAGSLGQKPLKVDSLYQLLGYYNLSGQLGISAAQIQILVSPALLTAGDNESTLASALLVGLMPSGQGQILQAQLDASLRDRLIPLAMQKLASQLKAYSPGVDGLCEYLLIDVLASPALKTSVVEEATLACQTYINRVLNQLEPGTQFQPKLTTLWQWMQNYPLWEANRQVYLYPENYIEPSLRRNSTTLFEKAKKGLNQVQLDNTTAVEQVFHQYFDGLQTLASMEVINAASRQYQSSNLKSTISLTDIAMLGRWGHGTPHYYLRVATFATPGATDIPTCQEWGEWEKINLPIQPLEYQPGQYAIPECIFLKGTWYIFWVTQKKLPNVTNTDGKSVTAYALEVQYTFLRKDGSWDVAQTLAQLENGMHQVTTAESCALNLNHDQSDPQSFFIVLNGNLICCNFNTLPLVTVVPFMMINNGKNYQIVNGVWTQKQIDLQFIEGGSTTDKKSALAFKTKSILCSAILEGIPTLGCASSPSLLQFVNGQWEAQTLYDQNQRDINNRYINALTTINGIHYATGDSGLFSYKNNQWALVIRAIDSCQIGLLNGTPSFTSGSTLYQLDSSQNEWNPNNSWHQTQSTCFGKVNGQAAIGTQDGLYLYQNSSWSSVTDIKKNEHIDQVLGNTIVAISEIDNVTTVFGKNGIVTFSNNQWNLADTSFTTDNLMFCGMGVLRGVLTIKVHSRITQPTTKWVNTIYEYEQGEWLASAVQPGQSGFGINNKISSVSQCQVPPVSVDNSAAPGLQNSISIQGLCNAYIGLQGSAQYLFLPYTPNGQSQELVSYRLNSTALSSLAALFDGPRPISSLMSHSSQTTAEASFSLVKPVEKKIPIANQPSDQIDFSGRSATSIYYWELFFHLPFLIAKALQNHQQFTHARTWYEYVFNPRTTPASQSGPYPMDLYWAFAGLQEQNNALLQTELSESPGTLLEQLLNNTAQNSVSDTDPFDPQALADSRPIAYQKTLVTHYINNLIAWGDALFTQNTRESIASAAMLYYEARDLLGQKPLNLGARQNFTALQDAYVGTGRGLFTYDPAQNTLTPVTTSPLGTAGIEMIIADSITDNPYFVGTSENGLYYLNASNAWSQVGSSDATFNTGQVTNLLLASKSGSYSIHLAGTPNGLYDGTIGSSWNLTTVTPLNKAHITCLGIDTGRNQAYVGTREYGLWWVTAGGTNWGRVGINSSDQQAFENAHITGFGQTPNDQLYVSTTQGMYKAIEGVWHKDNSMPAVHITLIYKDPNTNGLLAGTRNHGLYFLNTGGSSPVWASVGDEVGKPGVAIFCLHRPANKPLYVGTNRGLYTYSNNWAPVQGSSPYLPIQYLSDIKGQLIAASGNLLWRMNTGGNLEPIGYYLVPANAQLQATWGRLAQRLYNIRHGLTLNGQPDMLPLFQPLINPMQAIAAVGAGEPLGAATSNSSTTLPHYRFNTIIEEAKEAAALASSLGQDLLNALQSRDAEKLAMLYNTQQGQVLSAIELVKTTAVKVAGLQVQALQQGQQNAQDRLSHYQGLIQSGLLSSEQAEMGLLGMALVLQAGSDYIRLAAAMGYLSPNIFGMADGGMNIGDAVLQGAQIMQDLSTMASTGSQLAGISANFQRRNQDWQLQQQLAQDDINQAQYQIAAAQSQQDQAQEELAQLRVEMSNQQQIAQFYLSRFTNQQLYGWYIGKLSGLHRQAYQVALTLALQAQGAMNFELMGLIDNTANGFISPTYWNSLYMGLLSGESLQVDLLRMEKAYMAQNQRRLEVSKTISLARLDPLAMWKLQNEGSCTFQLIEDDFAFDYPGHYCRQIKTLSITLPLVLGPYENIHATLTQTSNKLVTSDDSNGQTAVKYLLNGSNGSQPVALKSDLRPSEQIAISRGMNDSGLFELNFDDPRYLPFEGTGAVSSWQLDIPSETNFFNPNSLTDVIIQLDYTALAGNTSYEATVKKAIGDFKGCFSIELTQLPGWSALATSALSIPINSATWLGVSKSAQVLITKLSLHTKANCSLPACTLSINEASEKIKTVHFASGTSLSTGSWDQGAKDPTLNLTPLNQELTLTSENAGDLTSLTTVLLLITYKVSFST